MSLRLLSEEANEPSKEAKEPTEEVRK